MGVNMSKFCMQCGKEIEDSADICTFCGAAQGGGVTSGGTDTAKNTNKAVAVINSCGSSYSCYSYCSC